MGANSFIERLKWLTRAPIIPPGPVTTGSLADALQCENVVLIALTDNGAMYQIKGGNISGGDVTRIVNPRFAVEELFNRFGVEDFDPAAFDD